MRQYAGDDTAFPITVGEPDDSDPNKAAIFNVGYEGLLDRTAWLKKRTGVYRIADLETNRFADETNSTTTATWNSIVYPAPTTVLTSFALPTQAGDLIEVNMSLRLNLANTVGRYGFVKLMKREAGGAWADLFSPESMTEYATGNGATHELRQVPLVAYDIVGVAGTYELALVGKAGLSAVLTWVGSWTLIGKVLRSG